MLHRSVLAVAASALFSVAVLPTSANAAIKPCTEAQSRRIASVWESLAARTKPELTAWKEVEKRSGYTKIAGAMALPQSPVKFEFTYYKSKKVAADQRAPIVFVYASSMGISPIEVQMAHRLNEKGVHVVVSAYSDEENKYRIETFGIAMQHGMLVQLALTDHFLTLPEIDPHRVGTMGLGDGGLRAAYQTAMDKRIGAAVAIATGIPPEEILATSNLKSVVELRNRHMANAEVTTISEYLQALNDMKTSDISNFACQRKSEDFYLHIADVSGWVPSRLQWRLFELLGHPERTEYNGGMLVAAALFTLQQNKLFEPKDHDTAFRFFQKKWARDALNRNRGLTPAPIPASVPASDEAGIDAKADVLSDEDQT